MQVNISEKSEYMIALSWFATGSSAVVRTARYKFRTLACCKDLKRNDEFSNSYSLGARKRRLDLTVASDSESAIWFLNAYLTKPKWELLVSHFVSAIEHIEMERE